MRLAPNFVRDNGRYHQHRAIACEPPSSRIACWHWILKKKIHGSDCQFLLDHRPHHNDYYLINSRGSSDKVETDKRRSERQISAGLQRICSSIIDVLWF
jgi:hypothetical protein